MNSQKSKKSGLRLTMNFSFLATVLSLLIIVAYIIISHMQWVNIAQTTQYQINRSAAVINSEFNSIIQDSSKIFTNAYLRDILNCEYRLNSSENYEVLTTLEGFFSNYTSNAMLDKPNIVIYHNNTNLHQNRYLMRFEYLDKNLYLKIENLKKGDGFWNTVNGDIYYYRKFYSSDAVLEYTVDSAILKRQIDFLERNYSEYKINYALNIEPSKKNLKTLSASLISGDNLNAALPYSVRNRIYTRNFFTFFPFLIILIIILYYQTKKTVKNITSNIYSFADTILSIDFINNPDYIPCEKNDKMFPIYSKINEMIHAINDAHTSIKRIEHEKDELHIKLLQSKINPHLLFNSLSVLKWQFYDSKPEFAHNIDTIVSYYREAISGNNITVSLEQEILLSEKYVTVMNYLRNNKYTFIKEIDNSLAGIPTLKLILQPFIENSILHGLHGICNPTIKVTAKLLSYGYFIKISDNGCGIPKEKLATLNLQTYSKITKSYGIKNTFDRIRLYYGDACEYKIESILGSGTSVIITIKQDPTNGQPPHQEL